MIYSRNFPRQVCFITLSTESQHRRLVDQWNWVQFLRFHFIVHWKIILLKITKLPKLYWYEVIGIRREKRSLKENTSVYSRAFGFGLVPASVSSLERSYILTNIGSPINIKILKLVFLTNAKFCCCIFRIRNLIYSRVSRIY